MEHRTRFFLYFTFFLLGFFQYAQSQGSSQSSASSINSSTNAPPSSTASTLITSVSSTRASSEGPSSNTGSVQSTNTDTALTLSASSSSISEISITQTITITPTSILEATIDGKETTITFGSYDPSSFTPTATVSYEAEGTTASFTEYGPAAPGVTWVYEEVPEFHRRAMSLGMFVGIVFAVSIPLVLLLALYFWRQARRQQVYDAQYAEHYNYNSNAISVDSSYSHAPTSNYSRAGGSSYSDSNPHGGHGNSVELSSFTKAFKKH